MHKFHRQITKGFYSRVKIKIMDQNCTYISVCETTNRLTWRRGSNKSTLKLTFIEQFAHSQICIKKVSINRQLNPTRVLGGTDYGTRLQFTQYFPYLFIYVTDLDITSAGITCVCTIYNMLVI